MTTDKDVRPTDDRPVERGKLDPDRKLDIALEGSMLTSEPPQIAEPKKAGETDADD